MIVYGMFENCSERDVANVSLMPSPKFCVNPTPWDLDSFPKLAELLIIKVPA